MLYSDTVYLAALNFCPYMGDSSIKKLVHKLGSAKKVWNTSKQELVSFSGIGQKAVQYIGDESVFKKAEREVEYCIENQVSITGFFEKEYPALLKECTDAPVLLYSKGNINWNNPCLSIVGTRKMTVYGKNFTEQLIESFQNTDINIISGLALGIDGAAHKKAVELGISTIGVLAHGLKTFYPAPHKLLAEEMLLKGGYITEFSTETKPDRYNFIQRNRIIAGLSPITIIVESAYGGGAVSTVKFANSYNREVFALPGKTTDIYSQGCNKLIQNLEAQIITRPEDISALFSKKESTKKLQTSLFVEVSAQEQSIISHLKENGKCQIDALCLQLNQPTFQLMPILLELELKNLVKPLPGNYFELF